MADEGMGRYAALERNPLVMHAWQDTVGAETTTLGYALERSYLCLSSARIIKNLQHLITLTCRH